VISSLTQFLNFRLSLHIVHARKRNRKNKQNKQIEISTLRRVTPVELLQFFIMIKMITHKRLQHKEYLCRPSLLLIT
jgi:hypothetical protein